MEAASTPEPQEPETPEKVSGHLVAVGYPHDVFESGVKDVDPITRAGTDVPKTKLSKVKEAAAASGVSLTVDGKYEDKS